MSTVECPPTPPTLPEGNAAITPPPKSPKSHEDVTKDMSSTTSKTRRPSSPEPNCAICLGKLENMSYTDACFHKFCFVCLKEWSKVKPECPQCRSKFKSIIHTIKSDEDYEKYNLPPPPPPPAHDASIVMIGDHEENRRFRYRTTMVPGGHLMEEEGERQELQRLRAMAAQMEQWRQQLPVLLPSIRRPPRISAGPSWNRRRGVATSEFRRDIYRRHLYVDPESIVDITGRYRECSPAWYRMNPAQTHRLVPWLNRELNALLEGSEYQSAYVTQKILQLVERFEIRSPEFHEKLLPYLGNRTDHFQHEFYHFARSVYDLIGYDRVATYTENSAPNNTVVSDNDDDDIVVVDEVRRTRSEEAQPATSSTSNEAPPVSLSLPPQPDFLPLDLMGPSTSTGISSSSAPLHRLVIPDSDSSDESDTNGNASKTNNDIEIVGVVKPRHERTPVIVDLSSDDERHVKALGDKSKAVANNDVMIEISSDTDQPKEKQELRQDQSDDEANEKRLHLMMQKIRAQVEFKRILKAKSDRSNERRYQSYMKDFKNRKRQRKNDDYEVDETWRADDAESSSSEADPDPRPKRTESKKGKGKGKRSSKNLNSTEEEFKSKKKKSKKRKKMLVRSSASSMEDDDSSVNLSKKQKKSKSKKKKSKRRRKDLQRSPPSPSINSSDEESSSWKITIKSQPMSTDDAPQAASTSSTLSMMPASTSSNDNEDLRLRLSRKRAKEEYSTEDEEDKPLKIKSVVCIPPSSTHYDSN